MRNLKAERGRSCQLAKRSDLLKIAGCNVRLRADPAAADRMNKGRSDELADVLPVDAAGRDELDPAERTRQGLHRGQAAINASREELHNVQAKLHRRHDFRRRYAAGRHSNTVLYAPADNVFVKARGNDKFGTALDGFFALFERDDRARAN